jgi:hypothetical protein
MKKLELKKPRPTLRTPDRLYRQKILRSVEALHQYAKPNWIYRGQRSCEWELKTSIERCFERERIASRNRFDLEEELYRDFTRAFHQYSVQVPEKASRVEIYSLMQHHGAPTRLLDCTYSIYVAAYFALEHAEDDCAIWVMNAPSLLSESIPLLLHAGKTRARELDSRTYETYDELAHEMFFTTPFVPCVSTVNAFRLNERSRAQKGIFSIPGDISIGFMENLRALSMSQGSGDILKLIVPHRMRGRFLSRLWDMNITRKSLFPGLDGYAQSLGVYHPSFIPPKRGKY